MATEDLSPFNKLKPKQQNFVIFTNSIIKKLTETELNFDELIENYEEYNEVEFKKSLKKDDDDLKDFNITFVYAAYQYIKKINAKIEPMEILEHALNYDAKKAKNLLKKVGLITPVKRAATKSKVTPEIKSAEEHLEEVIENENNDDSNNKKNDTKNKKKASSKKTEESPTTSPTPPKKSSKPAAVAAAAPKAAAKKVAAPKDDKKEHSPPTTKTTANVKTTDTKLKNQKKQLSSPEKTDNKNIVEAKPTKLEKKQSTKKPVKLQEIKQKLNFDSDSGDESDDDDDDNNSQKTSPLKAENNQKISADSDNETENEAEEAEETDDDDANSTDSNDETDSDNEK